MYVNVYIDIADYETLSKYCYENQTVAQIMADAVKTRARVYRSEEREEKEWGKSWE